VVGDDPWTRSHHITLRLSTQCLRVRCVRPWSLGENMIGKSEGCVHTMTEASEVVYA